VSEDDWTATAGQLIPYGRFGTTGTTETRWPTQRGHAMSEPNEQEDAAKKFLELDFVQCFTQMRHYEAQNLDLLKFTFIAYVALIGVAVGLYQFSKKENIDLIPVSTAILSIGLLFGVFMLSLIVRNRVYFVVVARYVNEHRRHFLKSKPLGFENRAKMYVSTDRPHFFNWRSGQSFQFYLLALLNSTVGTGILFPYIPLWCDVIVFVLALAAQLTAAILYLKSREPLSADAAVFGVDAPSHLVK
jgi:hypothetical protein